MSASARAAASRAAVTSSAGSIAAPASSAARWGDTGGPNRSGATWFGTAPVTAARSSWSIGRPGSGSSVPVTTGLNAATLVPPDRRAAATAAATTVFPAPVSVPVTKRPRKRRRLRGLGHVGLEIEGACAGRGARRALRRRLPGGDHGHAGAGAEARLQCGTAEDVGGVAQLRLRVGGHHRQAQPGRALGDRRRPDRLREDAL